MNPLDLLITCIVLLIVAAMMVSGGGPGTPLRIPVSSR